MSLFYFLKPSLKESTCLKMKFSRKLKSNTKLHPVFFHGLTDLELNDVCE